MTESENNLQIQQWFEKTE